MRKKTKWFIAVAVTLLVSNICVYTNYFITKAESYISTEGYIKWVDFNVSYAALEKTMNIDIKSFGTDKHISWIDLLAYLSCKYGGNFSKYKSSDVDKIVSKIKKGEDFKELVSGYKHYNYYHESISAVLGEFLGEFEIEVPKDGEKEWVKKYGLKCFSPIASGYGYSHYDDFGNSRSYGFSRRHLGNDLIGSIGTPIIAVESGYVETLGWNQYGGWRVGIRSFDKKRYYYYAHLRKDTPYHTDLEVGKFVQAGDVVGYLGMTGYSTKENVSNMKTPHLHFGMQLIFDESQKECNSEIWIDVYNIVRLLYRNRSTVIKNPDNKQYYRKFGYKEPSFIKYSKNE